MHDQTRPKRIHLTKGGESRQEENYAGAIITPGMLLALNNLSKVIPHGTAAGAAEKAFALEDALQGRTIGDNYASGELCTYILAQPGDVVYAILDDGENVAAGAILESAGNGYLQARTGNFPVAVALEAIDASGSDEALADRRIRVRIL